MCQARFQARWENQGGQGAASYDGTGQWNLRQFCGEMTVGGRRAADRRMGRVGGRGQERSEEGQRRWAGEAAQIVAEIVVLL
jgi:hypothetical protein